MRQISPEVARNSQTHQATYTLGGLLAFAAALPVLFVLLTAPQLVFAYVLGGLSAFALRYIYRLVRTINDNRERGGEQPASPSRDRRVQSR